MKLKKKLGPSTQLIMKAGYLQKIKYSWDTFFPVRGFLPSAEHIYSQFSILESHKKADLIWSNLR